MNCADNNSTVRLITLGSASLVSVDDTGTPLVLFRPSKPLALLIYLACSPARTASREHLINLLWADVGPERGLRTLRQTILQLRRALGEEAIISTGRDLSLTLALQFDRDDFLIAVAERKAEKAVPIYKGPFLTDFGIPGGAEFEHWADRERDRLHSAYVRSAESLIRSDLDHAQHDRAIAEARRLRDFEPDRESGWRLLLEALASSGDDVAAVVEAEALERFLTSEDREPESLTRSAINRAKKVRAAAPAEEISSSRLVAELTGRDREFAQLTSAWAHVKSGHFRHIHVLAPPGLGKTRLMQDVFTRLRASGARAIWIGAFAGERRLAYALASDVVGRIGQLSGASGISTAAASSLIALNPKLSSSFAASTDRSDGEEALRRRVHAVNELFEAVADETPFALFIDDTHWADPTSRQLLKSAFSRINDCRILLVTSSRKVPDGDLHLTSTETMPIEPLDRQQVWEFVSGFGALPHTDRSEDFVDTLHEHTGGSPLLILENLHLAIERDLLSLRDGEWFCDDPAQLIESILRGDALGQRLKKLDMRLFRTLLVLAVAEEPTAPAVVTDALKEERAAVDSDLATLDQLALASSNGEEWRCAHDSIAETTARMVPAHQLSEIHGALGTALAAASSADLSELRIAIRHLGAGGCRQQVQETFARAVAIARASGDHRSNTQLAAAMLGETVPTDAAGRLVGTLPFQQRVGLTRPRRVAAASAMIVAAIAVPYGLLPPTADRLAITTQPLAASVLVVPPPVVEIQDANGRRIPGAADTVTVSTLDPKPRLVGTLRVAAVDGRAHFKDVYIEGEGAVRLRFTSGRLKPADARPINVSGSRPSLRLLSGVINGQPVSPSKRSFTVTPGELISGDLILEYSSYWGSASVILGAAALWGDRTTNFLDLAPLFTPAERQPRRTSIRFRAPETPGTYFIVFAFDAEGSVEDFMSGTNWRLPRPIWNDGNDIADWTPAQLAQANAMGSADSRFVQIDNVTGKPRTDPHPVPATVIEVFVR